MNDKRWNNRTQEFEEIPEVDAFLAEINLICIKHNMSISHEDSHGSFVIEKYNSYDAAWLEDASDHRGKGEL